MLGEGDATVYAGGTTLVPQLQAGVRRLHGTLLNIVRLPHLRSVDERNGMIRLGALVTITDLLENELVRRKLPTVADMADRFASEQIRNAATLGGNLCTASPASDMVIPLLLHDAEVELASWSRGGVAERTVPLHSFFDGPGRTRKASGELVTGVCVPQPPEGFFSMIEKFGTRPALDIAVVNVGVAGVRDNGGLAESRVAFGSVAPIPMRGRRTESVLAGGHLGDGGIEEAARVAGEEISPISDVRASAWYRRHLVSTYVKRMLRHAVHA